MYMNENWEKGILYQPDNIVTKGLQFRYNIYAKQMQLISAEDTLPLKNAIEIDSIVTEAKTFLYLKYFDDNEVFADYFEVIVYGKCQLLKRRIVTFQIGDMSGTPEYHYKDRFVYKEYFYLKIANEK